MTIQHLIELMGSLTTDAEAEAMLEVLKERGIDPDRIGEMDSREFSALIPEAIAKAKETK